MDKIVSVWRRYRVIQVLGVFLGLVIISRFCIPTPAFNKPTSTAVFDAEGRLVGAKIAADGQWRFPPSDSIPEAFTQCIRIFEDQYFFYHFGVNPFSIARAFRINWKAGNIKQGGSTLTMQLARMMCGQQKRTWLQKTKEIFLSLHLEINYSKAELLNLYCSNAPFGGNVVGLSAAAWRYFGRRIEDLSWAEMATLAVLPNAPSLIYPGKNQIQLKAKRDRLLNKLLDQGIIDTTTAALAQLEELPQKPFPLPQHAPHMLNRVSQQFPGQRVQTTLENHLQNQVRRVVHRHIRTLRDNGIHNAGAIVIDVETNEIRAYVGNATETRLHHNDVDVVKANRSTGSVLKPFLYAAMIESGELLPEMLVPDIPTYISGYSPKNFFHQFDGAVRVHEALYRSLNVPFVRLLQSYGVERFHSLLKRLGMNSLVFPSGHYGLSLILGGAEGRLIELSSIYAGMSRTLQNFNRGKGYSSHDYEEASFLSKTNEKPRNQKQILSASSIYFTLEALTQLNRPEDEEGWKAFGSSRKLAWKTGTSFGNKDAWAIGVTPEYVVGVWVGNADGEGRPGLTGVSAAGPVLFDIYNVLGESTWFEEPMAETVVAALCGKSGYRASPFCEPLDSAVIPESALKGPVCPFHRRVHLTQNQKFQVHSNCEPVGLIKSRNWFVLPPAQEWFYKRKAPLYHPLPPFRSDCVANANSMEFIYPKGSSKVFIPLELDGNRGSAVFELAHRTPTRKVFWHLDGNYLGFSQDFHQMEIRPEKGWHELIVVDEVGQELVKRFEVLNP